MRRRVPCSTTSKGERQVHTRDAIMMPGELPFMACIRRRLPVVPRQG
jgi:hypothetical protein